MSNYLDEKPSLSELRTLVATDPKACSLWEDVLTALGFAEDDDSCQDEIAKNHKDDTKRLVEVFKKWLRDSRASAHVKGATWGNLLQVLRDLDINDAVSKVEKRKVTAPPLSLPLSIPLPLDSTVITASSIPLPVTEVSDLPIPAIDNCNAVNSNPATDPPPFFISPDMLNEIPMPDIHQSEVDFSLKMKPGHTVRNYQRELAQPGIDGENYIYIAPTGSGKTLVAGLVISEHLKKNQHSSRCHVVFIVTTKPLAEQQKRELDGLIPGARVDVCTGDTDITVAESITNNNDITVCTAGTLRCEMQKGKVKLEQLSLMVFDECHHARKRHSYVLLMESYLDGRKDSTQLPQVIGMTASPGAGDNPDLDKKKTVDHLLNLAALMDATGGIHTVTDNVEELQNCTKDSSFTFQVLKSREAEDDPFIFKVTREMDKLEKFVPEVNSSFEKWTQEYETRVQQVKHHLNLSTDEAKRDEISTLGLLRCYSNALAVYMDFQQKDSITIMEKYTDLPEDDNLATYHEQSMKHGKKSLIENLKQLPPRNNPLLDNMKDILCTTFEAKPTSRAIIFVRTKNHASAMNDWLSEHPKFRSIIRPDVITGHTRETGAGMTQQYQKDVMIKFDKGEINLLVATSVAEEGLDVPECNLVIRYQYVSNEIAKVQTEGRARAEGSQGFTILSSNSRRKYQELKNAVLTRLVEDILKNRYFPTGLLLQEQLTTLQQTILRERKFKIAMKKKVREGHKPGEVKFLCRKCKKLACLGSDIYTIGDDSHHYVVPVPQFRDKYITKDHQKPNYLDGKTKQLPFKKYKIYCANCNCDWGVQCIWPIEGHTFPVIKCAGFILEIKGLTRSIKKWKDAPFEMAPLSTWLRDSDSEDSEDSEDDS